MAVFLARVEGTTVELSCAGEFGCGHTEHEVDALTFEPVLEDGRVTALRYRCPACRATATAPRHTPESAAAVLEDRDVILARLLWHRVRWSEHAGELAAEALEAWPFLTWPIPPGEQTVHLARLWGELEELGWPELDVVERRRRLRRTLETWPVIDGEAA